MHACMHACIYIYDMSICVCKYNVCTHVYIYIYIYTHTYKLTVTIQYRCRLRPAAPPSTDRGLGRSGPNQKSTKQFVWFVLIRKTK